MSRRAEDKIWALQSLLTNYFYPQQYDKATTPHRRAERHDKITAKDKAILADTYQSINPAAVRRKIRARTSELLTLTTTKAGPKPRTTVARASFDESTDQSKRASFDESTDQSKRASRRDATGITICDGAAP